MKAYKVSSLEEWHAIRKQIITATESAAILGLDPYTSVSKMLAAKEVSQYIENAYMWVGNVLEPVVVTATNTMTRKEFKLFEDSGGKVIYADLELGLGATPDAGDGEDLLECKTTGTPNWYKWSFSPPIKYLVQLQVQLICTDRRTGYLSIMSTDLSQSSPALNLRLSVFKVTRSDVFETGLKKQLIRLKEAKKEGKILRVDRKHSSWMQLDLACCWEKVI